MSLLEAVKDLADLNARFTRPEIMKGVRERHPNAPLSDHALFLLTYAEYHQLPIDQFSEELRGRLSGEYLAFSGTGAIPLYFARCLLPP